MKIEILASGSKGNCYKVSNGNTALLLECGISYKDIQKKLNFKTKIDGCLLTHEHKDHAYSVKDLIKFGIHCYMSKGTAEALNIGGYYVNILKKNSTGYERKVIGDFIVTPFKAIHDSLEPLGFHVFDTSNGEGLVFITDTSYIEYTFPPTDYYLVECNYVKELIDINVYNKQVNINLRNRIVKNHMSLETLLDLLRANDLSKLKQIYVLHLSDSNSDENYIREEIQKLTGVPVVVC